MRGGTKGAYNRHILPRFDTDFEACEDAKKAALFPATFAIQKEADRAAGQPV